MGVRILVFVTTPDQEYIMLVLQAAKVMRKTQACKLLSKLDSRKTDQYTGRCLDQLRYMQRVYLTGDMLMLPRLYNAPADEDMLAAIDIMLDLTDIRIHAISASTPPYKLCFLAEQKNGMGSYAVFAASPGSEALISAKLQNSGQNVHTVIFLISEISQAESIKTAMPHFFALPDGGNYRYLSS